MNSTIKLDTPVLGDGDTIQTKNFLSDSNSTNYARAYYLRNKARKKVYYDNYYKKNKESILINQQIRKNKNPSCFNRIQQEILIDFS